MLNFQKPKIEDKIWVDECLNGVLSMNCEYTFGNLFVWSTAYSTQICKYDGFLMCRWGKGKDTMYALPIGNGDFKSAVIALYEDSKMLDIPFKIYGVTENYKKLLDEYFPDMFTYEYDEGNNDYIYSVEKMAALRGKKYHGKRNHITNFKKIIPIGVLKKSQMTILMIA